MTVMIETKAALGVVKELDEAIGTISKLVAKLRGQPDVAALKLAEALDEIGKTWQVTDDAIAKLFKVGFSPEDASHGSDRLLAIEGGALQVNVAKGRGHCHVIMNIFVAHLDRWFDRVLKGQELDAIRNVFYRLGNADSDVFELMEKVAEQLQGEANAALDAIAMGRSADAKTRIMSLRPQLNPFRLALSAALAKLYTLKGEFISIAGIA